MPVIDAREIAKTYPAQSGRGVLFGRGGIGAWFAPKAPPRQALAPMSLAVEPGESVGIIGRNGSGKSTLLKLIAGVSAPTSGTLAVHGRVASLLELGAGFHPMLTGRENVYLNAGLLGMRHAQVDACFDAIVDFSEIGEFIDRTVDTYSSGMYVRLAFSVAIHTNPDIFLVDEVLSVGDESFQRKCRARILELKAAGKTILFVSHDLGIVQALCDRVILLDHGAVLSRGAATDTINYYLRQIGSESGIHRLRHGRLEAIFNHGRLSLYCDQKEVTAPLGIKVQFYSMGTYHESTGAEWRITKASETELEATGTLPRLPVTIAFNVSLNDLGLTVEATWKETQPADIGYAALQCFFPVAYDRWYFGTEMGNFPPITPANHQWSSVALPRSGRRECALLCGSGDAPPVWIAAPDQTGLELPALDNADYMTNARLVHVTEVVKPNDNTGDTGRRLARLIVDPSQSMEVIDARREEIRDRQCIDLGACFGVVGQGQIGFGQDEHLLTDDTHLHAQFRIAGMWVMSHSLQWDEWPVGARGYGQLSGWSARFSFRLTFGLCVEENALQFAVDLEPDTPLAVEEFNISIGLASIYEAWETPTESGNFRAPEEKREGWRHINRDFAEGTFVGAVGAAAPPLRLSCQEAFGSVHPTAIVTDNTPPGRVIQLIVRPRRESAFRLDAQRVTLFRGRLSFDADGGE